jgi:hypothetical protein
MIPLIAVISVRHAKGRVRLWAPLFLVWLLLLPLALVLSPIALAACALNRIDPIRACRAAALLLAGLSGLLIEVESPAARVLVRIS